MAILRTLFGDQGAMAHLLEEEGDPQTLEVRRSLQGSWWGFLAMAFGTWGGLGPEGARVLHCLAKRAASWQEGELRSLRQHELLETVGVALMRQVWRLLANKNHLFR